MFMSTFMRLHGMCRIAVVGCIFVVLCALGLVTDESVSVPFSAVQYAITAKHTHSEKANHKTARRKMSKKNELTDLIYSS